MSVRRTPVVIGAVVHNFGGYDKHAAAFYAVNAPFNNKAHIARQIYVYLGLVVRMRQVVLIIAHAAGFYTAKIKYKFGNFRKID